MSDEQLKQGLLIVARAIVQLGDQRGEVLSDDFTESYRHCPVCEKGHGHENNCGIKAVDDWLQEVNDSE